MKVLLIQVDGKMPNLALMKLSAWHKQQGDEVRFNGHFTATPVFQRTSTPPDLVYASVIFSKNHAVAKGIQTWYPDAEFQLGGPGVGKPNYLPDKVEHIMPDYALYPDCDYSMGFTTRGCFRVCEFCVVPVLEGKFREHANIEEFHNPEFKKIVLMDNNFLASKNRSRTLDYIRDHKLKVCISQGMDARIMTSEIAEELASVKSYNQSFKHRTYIFAWDHIEDGPEILPGINEMINAGIKPRYIMVYVLVGFDSEYWQDIHRLRTLADMGVTPYVMKYNFKRDDPVLNSMAKWANSNQRYFKVCDLLDYKPLKKQARTKKVF